MSQMRAISATHGWCAACLVGLNASPAATLASRSLACARRPVRFGAAVGQVAARLAQPLHRKPAVRMAQTPLSLKTFERPSPNEGGSLAHQQQTAPKGRLLFQRAITPQAVASFAFSTYSSIWSKLRYL